MTAGIAAGRRSATYPYVSCGGSHLRCSLRAPWIYLYISMPSTCNCRVYCLPHTCCRFFAFSWTGDSALLAAP